jgi:predicted dinucleotide-binding enzyme
MKIGIIGTGAVAMSLAEGYRRHGHEVRLGTRTPDRPEAADWAPAQPADVAAWAALVVLTVPGSAAADVADQVASAAAGKVLIDTSNWIERSADGMRLGVGPDDSLGERVQRAAPDARVVKAYNSVGAEHMVDPSFPDGTPTMFIAGDDAGAKAVVTDLLTATGWQVTDMGGIASSRLFDQLVLTWIGVAAASGSRNHAFAVLRK